MSKNDMRHIFKENINALMGKKGVTQKELADYMGVSPTTVNNWVKGYKIPRMDKIDKLCQFFSVERVDIIESRSDKPAPPPAASPAPPAVTERGLSEEALAIASAYDSADTYAQGIAKAALNPYSETDGQESSASTNTDAEERKMA